MVFHNGGSRQSVCESAAFYQRAIKARTLCGTITELMRAAFYQRAMNVRLCGTITEFSFRAERQLYFLFLQEQIKCIIIILFSNCSAQRSYIYSTLIKREFSCRSAQRSCIYSTLVKRSVLTVSAPVEIVAKERVCCLLVLDSWEQTKRRGERRCCEVYQYVLNYEKGPENSRSLQSALLSTQLFVRVRAFSQTNPSGRAQHTCLLISGGRVRGALSRICVSLPCAFWLSQVEDEVESEAKVLEVED